MINNHLYRIDVIFQKISQAGNADNFILVSELLENNHSYIAYVDSRSGQFVDVAKEQTIKVTIPKSLLEVGYDECSKFAENFNNKLAEKFGIQLVDKKVLEKLEDIIIPLPVHQLPTIENYGHRYEVDVSLNELRKADEQLVSVSFANLKMENGKYIAYMNTKGKLEFIPREGYEKFEIEQLVKIAPDEVAKVFGIAKQDLPCTDQELKPNPEFVINRETYGALPIIRIVDEDFYVDTRLRELRSCSKFWKKIDLNENSYNHNDQDNKHVFIYDYLNREISSEYDYLTEAPKHCVFVILPDIKTLDPIAAGRIKYNDPYHYLNKYSVQPKMEARIVPVEVFMPKLAKANKQNQAKDKAIKPNKNKRNKRLGF